MSGNHKPRPIRFQGIENVGSWRLKRYDISVDDSAISEPVSRAVGEKLGLVLPPVPAGEHGIGFLVVHQGEQAVWVLADLWTGDIVSQHTFSAPLDDPTWLTQVPAGGPMACVFELPVHWHESQALIRHVLDPADGADLDGYLADVLTVS